MDPTGYAVIDGYGNFVTVAPDAASAAAIGVEMGAPNVWIDNEMSEGPRELMGADDLGAPFRLKALQASTLPVLDEHEVMSMTLEEAHSRLRPYFPSRKRAADKSSKYDRPLTMADAMLGQNYKTAKTGSESAANADAYQKLRKELQNRYGADNARVQGLSFVPHHLMLGSRGGEEFGHFDQFLHNVPDLPSTFTLCKGATSECRASCLVYSGQNSADPYNTLVKFARTTALLREPVAFARVLAESVARWAKRIEGDGVVPMFRLNVFSDIPWEEVFPWFFRLKHNGVNFGETQFYDYTKVAGRDPPSNYDLTFSYAGPKNKVPTRAEYARGRRIAVVFLLPAKAKARRTMPLPPEWCGFPVVDGDISDMRPLDPKQVVVGLRWKIPARQYIDPATTTFAIKVTEECGALIATQSARQEPIVDADAED